MKEYLLSELLELTYQPSDLRSSFKAYRRHWYASCPTQLEIRSQRLFQIFVCWKFPSLCWRKHKSINPILISHGLKQVSEEDYTSKKAIRIRPNTWNTHQLPWQTPSCLSHVLSGHSVLIIDTGAILLLKLLIHKRTYSCSSICERDANPFEFSCEQVWWDIALCSYKWVMLYDLHQNLALETVTWFLLWQGCVCAILNAVSWIPGDSLFSPASNARDTKNLSQNWGLLHRS